MNLKYRGINPKNMLFAWIMSFAIHDKLIRKVEYYGQHIKYDLLESEYIQNIQEGYCLLPLYQIQPPVCDNE